MINEQHYQQIVSFATDLSKEIAVVNDNPDYESPLTAVLSQTQIANPWFTKREQIRALTTWCETLLAADFKQEISRFTANATPKKVGVIAAGNIPLVGLHDALSVLISGNHLLLKCSSEDKILLPWFLKQFVFYVPDFKGKYEIVQGFKSNQIDALIATGSDNSARYFEYYFRDNQKIIRKNRTSVAVLSGNESEEELSLLGEDIFAFFGLGCRNVTQLLVPKDFDVQRLFKVMPKFEYLADHHKYMNNYTYNKAMYLMNQTPFLENGFVNVVESNQLHSPVSCVHYMRYQSEDEVATYLKEHESKIQCVVGRGDISFGVAQEPRFSDYADKVNTLAFLCEN